MKTKMTRTSVLNAVEAGAKSFTKVAHAHGYKGSVSSGTAREIRKLVPEIADLFAGTMFVAQITKPAAAAPKAKAPKAEKAVVRQEVRQRSKAYGGQVYGPVFGEAVAVGKIAVKTFVTQTAAKLGLEAQQVEFATQVLRNPNHKTNGNRSRDIAGERGVMQIAAVEVAALAG